MLTAFLIPLLGFLEILQLRWINEVAERERFRLMQGLSATAGQLAAAFQNEIGILPAVFGFDRRELEEDIARDDWSDFKERWELWKAYALEPSIVADFHLLRASGAATDGSATGGTPSTYELRVWDGSDFAIDRRSDLKEALGAVVAERKRKSAFLDTSTLSDGTEALILPLGPDSEYWFIIRIDREVLVERLIPLLADRYLYGKTDYRFRIVDRSDGSTIYASDASEAGFGENDLSFPLLRSDFMMAFGPPEGTEMESGGDPPALGLLKTRRDAFFALVDPDHGDSQGPKDKRVILRMRSNNDRWVLEAVHKSGSLAAAVRAMTIRSAAIGTSILALLAVALVTLALAFRRKQELAERQSEFIASVTHELKTPIAVIRSAADNLADGIIRDADKTARYGETIRQQGKRLSDMIDRLLRYSRIGDDGPMELRSIDLAELIERTLDRFKAELNDAGFRVERTLPAGIRVSGDATALELALANLVSNALKHARDGAFLGVDLHADGKWATVSVRDHGNGIPRTERRAIFEAFYRGQEARERQTGGSGLGLNLVRRVCRSHGGNAFYQGRGALGAAFRMRLPLEVANG
ncbi:MAG: hypothetical protein A2Z99_13185 [Treponema sp. GWB1_62_6]|nr:MAG: hypothetical protein A2Z99_13185 [Treponema sp. GWB1_62_6]OHE63532.1 MAG: hypothetical protein A2001_19170 [Treponema sp. GWC1_61_84]